MGTVIDVLKVDRTDGSRGSSVPHDAHQSLSAYGMGLELVAQIGSDSEWALQEMLLIGVSCCHDADRSAVEAD